MTKAYMAGSFVVAGSLAMKYICHRARVVQDSPFESDFGELNNTHRLLFVTSASALAAMLVPTDVNPKVVRSHYSSIGHRLMLGAALVMPLAFT